jgi:hypothetical protein
VVAKDLGEDLVLFLAYAAHSVKALRHLGGDEGKEGAPHDAFGIFEHERGGAHADDGHG